MERLNLRKHISKNPITTIMVLAGLFTTFVVMAADMHLPSTDIKTVQPNALTFTFSTSQPSSLVLPSMSTTTRGNFGANTEGQFIYNLTNHIPEYWNGSSWTSAGSSAVLTTLGDMLYENSTPANAKLSGNTTSTKKYLSQTGTGTVSAAPVWLQPACGDLSNASASCSTDATNASNISSGTLGAARLPNPSASTLGGIQSAIAVTHQWINSISTSGVPALSQPAFSDISGTASLTSQVTGVLPIANGGTNNGSLAVTSGATLYTDGSKIVSAGAGTTGQVLTSNGSSAPTWKAATGGLISAREFSTNTTIDIDASGYSAYADAAGTRPVDGTGGSPNTTCAFSSSSPLTGTGSLLITKAGSANRQGEGCSYDFTADIATGNGTMALEFDYNVTSGTFTAGTVGTSPTDSDIEVFIYDKTNGALVSLSDYKLYVSSVTPTHFKQVFKGSASISYRAIFHIATTTTNNFTFQMDNISEHVDSGQLTISPMSDWVPYTPTFAGLGTTTNVAFQSRRVGSDLEIQGFLTAGTTTATPGTFTIGYGGTNANVLIDGTKLPNGTTKSNVVGYGGVDFASAASYLAIIQANATTAITLGGQTSSVSAINVPNASGLISAGQSFSIHAKVPIIGWTSSEFAVRMDQSNYGWTSYTPTFTGFGTVTSPNCFHKRSGQDLMLRCKWTNGTPTATEARVSFPSGLTSDSGIATLEYAGFVIRTAGAGTGFYNAVALREPSVSYVTFGMQSPSNAALTKVNGNTFTLTSDNLSIEARIPISGWTENQNAPALVGSVTSNSFGSERIERATITGSATTPTIASQSGAWLSPTITRASAGAYNYTINTGMFSSAPSCTCRCVDVAHSDMCQTTATTTTTALNTNCSSSSSGFDTNVEIICMGPR